jgi:hypothetical protein
MMIEPHGSAGGIPSVRTVWNGLEAGIARLVANYHRVRFVFLLATGWSPPAANATCLSEQPPSCWITR